MFRYLATFPLLNSGRSAIIWFSKSERWKKTHNANTQERPSRAQLVVAAIGPIGHRIFDVTDTVLNRSRDADEDASRSSVRLRIPSPPLDVQLSWLFRRQPPLLLLFYGHLPHTSAEQSPLPLLPRRRRRHSEIVNTAKDKRCRLHEWAITFDQIGWQGWVVAPPGIQINYCAGECSMVPLNNHISPHAMMRGSYLALHSPNSNEDIPQPCCVPTRLRDASMITVEMGVIEIIAKKGMVATECGCA